MRKVGIFGAVLAAVLALPGVASANDAKGALSCTEGALVKLDWFPRGANVNWRLTQDGVVAAQGTVTTTPGWFNGKVADLVQDGAQHEWKLYVLPWNVNGHVGGSETVPVAATTGVCGLAPPPVTPPGPPATPNPPPPGAKTCTSRRVIRVRVAREWKNRLRSGQLYHRARKPGGGKLRLRTQGAQKGKLTGVIDFRGLKWRKDQRTRVKFVVYTNAGSKLEGHRSYRPCTVERDGINLKIGVRVPFAERTIANLEGREAPPQVW